MRLHILPDEKIINRTIDTFEHVFPNDNKYIIISDTGDFKHVDVNHNNVFPFTSVKGSDFWRTIGDVSTYSAIIIHYLTNNAVYFLNKIKHPNIYWIEWGYDLYNNLLEPRGFHLYSDPAEIESFLYSTLRSKYLHKYFSFLYPRRSVKQAISKVHYFVPDSMYDEYPLLLSYYPQFKHLVYKDFFYYPIDQVVGPSLRDERCCGNNIIVGNSCSYTGNHIEIIKKLSSIDLSGRKIKFPINYAGSADYRDYVIKKGEQYLGDKFQPLTEYLPLERFNQYLLNASYFIYNNYRQEAVGNILVALFIGGKVYLSDNSPLLRFYKNLGLIIFPVSDISEQSLSTPLEEKDININRSIIEKVYSLDRLYSLVKQNFL